MYYCSRPKAEGNSASGRPRHRGLWCIGPSEAPRGYGFDYSPNIHEITVLLPNQYVKVLTNRYDISIH